MKTGVETASQRARLPKKSNPIFVALGGVRGGISLGYRSTSGTWVGKCVFDGKRFEKSIGQADDAGIGGLDYAAASQSVLAWSRQIIAPIGISSDDDNAVGFITVAEAIEQTGALRNTELMLRKNLFSSKLAGIKLTQLTARDLEKWRAGLPANWKAATSQPAAGRCPLRPEPVRRPPRNARRLAGEIRAGTKPLSIEAPTKRQLLSDGEVRKLIDAAFTVDNDLGAMVLVLASTGARFAQAAAMTVGDVQEARQRVLVPAAGKGRSARPKPAAAIPMGAAALSRLVEATGASDRPQGERLLMRLAIRNDKRTGSLEANRKGRLDDCA